MDGWMERKSERQDACGNGKRRGEVKAWEGGRKERREWNGKNKEGRKMDA